MNKKLIWLVALVIVLGFLIWRGTLQREAPVNLLSEPESCKTQPETGSASPADCAKPEAIRSEQPTK